MPLKLITAPAAEPVTRANVKIKLGIAATDTSSDTQIDWMIPSARRVVEQKTNRALITQTWSLYLDKFPDIIYLPLGNVQSVTYIKYIDTTGSVITLASANYQIDIINVPARLAPSYDIGSWPTTRDSTFNSVEIQFIAGYGLAASIPDDIIEAMYRIIGHWLNNQTALEHGTSITRIPFAIEQMLWPYIDYSGELNT